MSRHHLATARPPAAAPHPTPLLLRLWRWCICWSSLPAAMEPPTWAGGSGDNSTRKLALQIFEELRKVGKRHERSAGLLMSPADVLRFTFATRWASTGWLSAASHLAAAAPYSVLSLLSVVPLEDSDKSTNWIWHLAFLLLPAGSMCCTVPLAWTVTSSCATSASWQTQTEASLATCSCPGW